ncbi:MAG TPA: Asp-tRNA(Asn)/Glu-tRNA(Gln) amidotransferase GatCAB subunit B, partial [Alphaproteobacteria bacterium]|nr:Asp-tRNA(Asn)/Glu-tRNA(Gln) amidotransferase GatCAB subunit B [Alphaproteobacteria bacterium]
LLDLLADKTLSSRLAKDVFEIMLETGDDPQKIVADRGLKQVTDTGAIEAAIDRVMAENPDKVEEVKGGKEKLLGWFVGQVMKATQGKANPQIVNEMLRGKFDL